MKLLQTTLMTLTDLFKKYSEKMFNFVDVQKVLLEKLMGGNFSGKASDLIKSMLINTECVKLDRKRLN